MHKASQFIEAADTIRELADEHEDAADAYVTLCVHAGIASDVICCARLGEHARGENHDEAPATADEFKRAGRAAQTLVETARRVAAAR
ncbi:hypothetical protein [Amycolatopsis sp. cmx-11-51]|uniref:hypothetical protein n=1 Tax=unclassified Amycolatopsis TaxID=2618356 RepID=UPI0039E3C54B